MRKERSSDEATGEDVYSVLFILRCDRDPDISRAMSILLSRDLKHNMVRKLMYVGRGYVLYWSVNAVLVSGT